MVEKSSHVQFPLTLVHCPISAPEGSRHLSDSHELVPPHAKHASVQFSPDKKKPPHSEIWVREHSELSMSPVQHAPMSPVIVGGAVVIVVVVVAVVVVVMAHSGRTPGLHARRTRHGCPSVKRDPPISQHRAKVTLSMQSRLRQQLPVSLQFSTSPNAKSPRQLARVVIPHVQLVQHPPSGSVVVVVAVVVVMAVAVAVIAAEVEVEVEVEVTFSKGHGSTLSHLWLGNGIPPGQHLAKV